MLHFCPPFITLFFCRVENLAKFKSNEGDCPTLVCTDLAARGLDLDVDQVIMFDFPKNSVSTIFGFAKHVIVLPIQASTSSFYV